MLQVFLHASLAMVCLTPSPTAPHDFAMTCYPTTPAEYESYEITPDELWRDAIARPELDISLRVGDMEYWPARGYSCEVESGYCGGDE